MKKILLICLACLLPLVVFAEVNILPETDYQELRSKEREQYNQSLVQELEELRINKANAINSKDANDAKIADLNKELANLNSEYNDIHARVLHKIGVNPNELSMIRKRLDNYYANINNWQNMSDDELWAAKKQIRSLHDDFAAYSQTKYAKVPDYLADFSDLKHKFLSLDNNLKAAAPKYYEEDYLVQRGDYLAKIAAYDFIYGDAKKWGVIYRANRDQIKDPHVISPDMTIKIPRGLPNVWKVWSGESLWKIASYPEVYGKGVDWPLLYRANKDSIKDPNIIYPKQVIDIPRD